MVRQGKKMAAPDLVNFHFPSSPPPQSQSSAPRRTNRNSQQQQQQRYRRSDQDRSSARRKPASSMFYLHSSADHSFVITRRAKQGYSFSGSDVAVPWEAVRTVKYLVPSVDSASHEASQESCPVCLDSFTCTRITKCGHCFCLPCLLRHVHSHTEANKSQAAKCPCCGLPIHVEDFRLVILESVQTPRIQSKIKLVKLHRTKDCPAPFLPLRESCKHSSPHAAPTVTDRDSPYCRFNYVDTMLYQSQLLANQLELESQLAELQPQQRIYPSVSIDILFLQMSLESVRSELRKALEESQEEHILTERFRNPHTGMYQPIPDTVFASGLVNGQAAEETGARPAGIQDTPLVKENCDLGHCIDSVDGTSRLGRSYRGDSIDSADTSSHDHSRSRHAGRQQRRLQALPASVYLDHDASHFYQSVDGQLCFLSKFNMNCLVTEFSALVPDLSLLAESTSPPLQRKLRPLPDVLEGQVLEKESIHLTPEIRKRVPFLSHLPLYSDISFVELDLNSILSETTKLTFKADFEQRTKRRQSRITAEKRADRIAKKKEEQRINEIKSRIQRIDPNDEFFHMVEDDSLISMSSEDFGPALSPCSPGDGPVNNAAASVVPHARNPALSFSAVCAANQGFPIVSRTQITEEEAFPSLSSSLNDAKPTTHIPSWGSSRATALTPIDEPTMANLSISQQQILYPIGKGKKSKSKKIVLFSTGGHRGNV